MKKLKTKRLLVISLSILSFILMFSCDNNDDENPQETSLNFTQLEKESLLFMLEEEKLARDTYIYLNNLWSINVFSNISNSEQTHMNAVADLLTQNDIAFSILPIGEFENVALQNYYNQFIIDGQTSLNNALKIGATIEDLDIVDLENYINEIESTSIIEVYETLKCGSRNHLRSFVSTIIANNDTYTPQFLSIEEYNEILNEDHENCN